MPQAPAYNRARDFATQSGSATDNAGINAELDSISLSINAQRSNSAILQRDDGGLKDAVVGVNALSRETLNLIGGLVYRGVWSANTAYQSKDIVSNAGMLYVCSVAHTSPATFVELPNWKAFGFAGSSEAALSAAQAAASASASANSAADALTSKNAAATSATNAASSASAALSSKNDAAASASAASLSKDFAANSATASANSANGITVSATGLAAGASPTVTRTGTAPNINVAFGIPKGDKGDTGATGATGAAGAGDFGPPYTQNLGFDQTYVNGTGRNQCVFIIIGPNAVTDRVDIYLLGPNGTNSSPIGILNLTGQFYGGGNPFMGCSFVLPKNCSFNMLKISGTPTMSIVMCDSG